MRMANPLLRQNQSHGKPYGYLIALLLPALIINAYVVQWALAVIVGGYSLAGGFHDVFKYFNVFGYLLITAANLVPYGCLWKLIIVLSKTRFRDYNPAVFAGGLIGILAFIIWGLWDVQRPLYTGEHVSSTTAVAFLFIPIYAVPAGGIGALLFAAIYTPFRYIFRKEKAESCAGDSPRPTR